MDAAAGPGTTDRSHDRVILVTGAAGFIGSHMVDFLVQKYRNYLIVGLDKMSYCSSMRNLEQSLGQPNFVFLKGDIVESGVVLSILQKYRVDGVLHLAASSHVDRSFGDSLEFTRNNVLGTHMMLEAVREYGVSAVKSFIHVSTDEVYGGGESECDISSENADHVGHSSKSGDSENYVGKSGNSTPPIKSAVESSLLAPTNPYAATKAAAECLVKAYFKSFSLPVIITRSNNVYGPRQYPEKIIPKFICRLFQSKSCCIHGSGQESRNYLFIDDITRALDLILHRGEAGQVYNIGGNSGELSNLQLAQMLVQMLATKEGDERFIEFVADRPFNDKRYRIDSRKLRLELGWMAETSFDKGLARTIEWYRNTVIQDWWTEAEHVLDPHPHHLD